MALTNNQITAQNFKDFYEAIRPYLGGAHGGFTPIGTVIAVMGNSAPANYLACDGTVYNIADYPELARYFYQQFEAINFFGGDGTTTFAVPDLRGEFLRGTGTNNHTNQGDGANVGIHQDGTEMPLYCSGSTGNLFVGKPSAQPVNYDKWLTPYTSRIMITGTAQNDGGSTGRVISRPTNTSVLYCIAVKNIFMDAGSNYSTDEQVVGTWIDGKPLYQRSYSFTFASTATNKEIATLTGLVIHEINGVTCEPNVAPLPWLFDTNNKAVVFYDNSNNKLYAYATSSFFNKSASVTIKYTKTS